MDRRKLLGGIALLALAACAPQRPIGEDGLPTRGIYRIDPAEAAEVQFRLLDGLNAIRSSRALVPVAFDASLNAAAATHARDMALQNRPWNFGSDGSSPIDRARRAGFSGLLIGEAISETFETELETLAAWMADPGTRPILLDPRARRIGFGWLQEENGKIWWVLEVGT